MKIQVIGPGCAKCKKLLENTKEALKQLSREDEIEYITDMDKIIEMGIMSTPVLAFNGVPALAGFLPEVDKIKETINAKEAKDKKASMCHCGGCC